MFTLTGSGSGMRHEEYLENMIFCLYFVFCGVVRNIIV